MKAIVCKEFGPPSSLVYEDVELPELKKSQIQIDVHSAGVNFPDTLIIQDKYQVKPPLPFSPGGEISGVISATGESVSDWKVGDEVVAMIGFGGFREQVITSPSNIFRKPSSMDFTTASCFTLTYGTSHYALKNRGQLKEGENLLVLGAAGGVGISAVEIGKAMGARVIAGASSDEKLEVCKEYGADEVINYGNYDLTNRDHVKEFRAEISKATGGKGPDVIYDPVGADFTEPALRSIAWNGRFLVIGWAAGHIPKIPMNLYLIKGCSAVGVFWGQFTALEPQEHLANMNQLTGWYEEGKLKAPVTEVLPLEKGQQALETILARKATGKIALTTSFYKS
jgi:NADPH2:quinone reductase